MAGLALSLGFLGGVLLHDSGIGSIVVVPVVLAALLVALLVKGWQSRIVVGLTLLLVCVGAWRAEQSSASGQDLIVQVTGGDRAIDATVSGVPRTSTSRTEVTLKLTSAEGATVSASLPAFPEVRDGDIIEFWAPVSWNTGVPGQVRLPISAESRDLFVPAFAVVGMSNARTTRLRRTINEFVTRSVTEHVPEPSGALTLGILTGDDSGMTDATRVSFRSAGMSHITAVSGWNVAIVAGLIALIARRLTFSRSAAVAGGLMMIWAYAFIVGMEPSVLRAAGMASVFLLAQWRGRPGDVLTALMLVTSAMVALRPSIRFDIGFQLSVAATFGLVLLLETASDRPWWQSALAVPFVAEIAVAPILLHHLGTYSIVSPLANLITAPLVELVMAGGIATIVGSVIHPFLGDLAGAFTWVPARIIVGMAERTSSLTWSTSTTMTLSWSATLVTYLVIGGAYLSWARFSQFSRYKRSATAPVDPI